MARKEQVLLLVTGHSVLLTTVSQAYAKLLAIPIMNDVNRI